MAHLYQKWAADPQQTTASLQHSQSHVNKLFNIQHKIQTDTKFSPAQILFKNFFYLDSML